MERASQRPLRHRLLPLVSSLLIFALIGVIFANPTTPVYAANDIIYVKPAATGTGDGSSWANATTLQDALQNQVQANDGDQVWVAAGTYTPTDDTNRAATFNIPSGVAVYGGFEGIASEASLDDRDLEEHTAILSGAIGAATVNDNSTSVVTMSGANSDTILDGFFIIDGNASGGATGDQNRNGGGLFAVFSSPTLRNLTFVGNSALEDGGAVFFQSNNGNTTLVNVVFTGNTATENGGAVTFDSSFSGSVNIVNNTFSNNEAATGDSFFAGTNTTTTVKNSIFWDDTPPASSHLAGTAPTVTFSIVQGGFAGSNNTDVDPQFVDADGADDTVGTVDDNVRLNASVLSGLTRSPAIDSGQNTSLPGGVVINATTLDRESNARLFDFPVPNSPTILDRGAYEFVNLPPTNVTIDDNTIIETTEDADLVPNPFPSKVGTLATNDPDNAAENGEGDTHTYEIVSVTDNDGNTDNTAPFDFAIVNDDELEATRDFNFEVNADKEFTVAIQTTDSTGLTLADNSPPVDPVELTITIEDVNERPNDLTLTDDLDDDGNTPNFDNATVDVRENQPAGTDIGTFTTDDPDVDNPTEDHTYTLVTGTGSEDNIFFQIDGDKLQTAAILNFEDRPTDPIYTIRVRTTDQGGLFIEEVYTIEVLDEPDAADAIRINPSNQIAEDAPVNTIIGSLAALAEDPDPPYTFTLVDTANYPDNNAFTILTNGASRLQITDVSELDFETKKSYRLRIQAVGTSTGAVPFAADVLVQVTNVNEAPTAVELDPSSVADTDPVGTQVGVLTTVDPDTAGTGNENNDSFTYTLTDDAGGLFTLGAGANNDKVLLNQTRPAVGSYDITVQSEDSGGLTISSTLSITVTDGNRPPSALAFTADPDLPSDFVPTGTDVGTFSVTDPDAGDTFTYQLIDGTGSTDNARFSISDDTLQNAEPLFPGEYTIRVEATDPDNNTIEETLTITIEGDFIIYLPVMTTTD